MKNQNYLEAGDLVKYHVYSRDLHEWGFELGQTYRVMKGPHGELSVDLDRVGIVLIMPNGELTEFADHFAKQRNLCRFA